MNKQGEQPLGMELWLVLNALMSLNEEKLLRICRTLRKNFRPFTVFPHHWQLPGSLAEGFFGVDWLLIIYDTISTIVTIWFIMCCLLSVKMMTIFHAIKKIIHAHSLQRKLQLLPPTQTPPEKGTAIFL